ncbi:MAG: lipase family protein, partial [Pseudomonadota bacterium]
MVTKFDYAALSALIYNDARGKFNVLTIPAIAGWNQIGYVSGSGLNGFTAGAYQNGTDIVIAFKGTDISLANAAGTVGDVSADLALAFGLGSTQLAQAALFYQQIKATNPGANITFTGHSLGGGLASIMSVWFNRPATTFDEAPFEATALNPLVMASVSAYLGAKGYSDSEFLSFIFTYPLIYGGRESQVTHHFVQGEMLEYWRRAWPTVLGSDNNPIVIGGGDTLPGGTLHSMNLAAALLMQDKLRADTVALPNLLPAIFDEKLYANNLAGSRRDFLTSLLNDQITQGYTNPDGALAKFATDIEKLAQGGMAQNNDDINKALIVAGMEYYYFKDPATTTALFTAAGNGLHFKYSDIGASSYKSLPLLARAIETLLGPAQSFQAGIYGRLIKQDAWHVQSGSGGMTWTATGADNDAAMGGDQEDVLDAGAGNDILLGLDGSDTLTGGLGDDLLIGGAGDDTLNGGDGYDTYIIEGNDTIRDSDG